MTKNLFLIHGAWASPVGFNHIHKMVNEFSPSTKIKDFVYDTNNDKIEEVLARIKFEISELSDDANDVVVVGHSLGGVLALSTDSLGAVSDIVTLAAPLSGVKFALLVQMYIYAPLVKAVSQESNYISDMHKKVYNKSYHVLAATRGYNPLLNGPNDGVVTIKSQIEWTPENSTITKLEVNHHEILQAEETCLKIIDILN